jgi:hypothetical protein
LRDKQQHQQQQQQLQHSSRPTPHTHSITLTKTLNLAVAATCEGITGSNHTKSTNLGPLPTVKMAAAAVVERWLLLLLHLHRSELCSCSSPLL